MIKVISQNTSERHEETVALFNDIKPLLDDGYNYSSALMKIGRIKEKNSLIRRSWFRELIEYGDTKGYNYRNYMGTGFK